MDKEKPEIRVKPKTTKTAKQVKISFLLSLLGENFNGEPSIFLLPILFLHKL